MTAEECTDSPPLKGIPELIAEAKAAATLTPGSIPGLRGETTSTLISRVPTTTQPVMLWALHMELDRRDVAPCLRGSHAGDDEQLTFITWLADMRWHCRRNKGHTPHFSRWNGLYREKAGSQRWHRIAIWVYRAAMKKKSRMFYFARGLALTDAQRQPLATMPTNAMRGDRRILRRLDEFKERLFADAATHRDRSGARLPGDVAARRTRMLQIFLLSGRSPTMAAKQFAQITGEAITRQALSRQIEAIERATRLRLLES